MNQKKSAFTLIELLVVIVIIGILATISVAQFNKYQEKARLARAQAFAAQASQQLKAKITAQATHHLLQVSLDSPTEVIDASGNNANGILKGNPTHFTGGSCYNHGCFYFDGVDDYINFAANKFDLSNGDFTVEGWFYMEDLTPSSAGYIFRYGNNGNDVISIRTAASPYGLVTEIGDHGTGKGLTNYGSNGAYKERWQHVLITYSKDTGLLDYYVDGQKTASHTLSPNVTSFLPSGRPISLGGGLGLSYYKGFIDEFSVYPVAFIFDN